MKAIVCTAYGSPDVLQLVELEKPTPKEHEVLIKVYAASVNAADWRLMRADPVMVRLAFGLRKPRNRQLLGADISGRVEQVGSGVTRLKVGDEVFGDLSGCGNGGFADYVCADADVLVKKSAEITHQQAAALPMATVTALQGLRDVGNLQSGQHVLINGASGGVGSFAVQIAKALGAEVTAVCSTKKLAFVQSIGADHVIDYRQEDFTQNGQQYDFILDIAPQHSAKQCKQALTANGIYVVAGGSFGKLLKAMILAALPSRDPKKVKTYTASVKRSDLQTIKEMVDTGQIVPSVDTCFTLAETADAIRYMEEGYAKGKVIITNGDA